MGSFAPWATKPGEEDEDGSQIREADFDHFYHICIDSADPAVMLAMLDDLSQDGCLIDENAAASARPPHMEPGQVWSGSYLCSQVTII